MNSSRIIIGRYINSNSVIHRLNPLVKFFALILLLTLTFWSHLRFEEFAYLCIIVVILFVAAKIPLRLLISQWRNIIFLFLVIFLIGSIFSLHGTTEIEIESIGKWHFPKTALPNSLFIAGRIFVIVNIAAFLTSTSTSSEITTAILYILSPLRILRVPTNEISLMVSIALRFIPTFVTEADIITKAQASRGLDIRSRNIKRKVTAFVALIIPLFLSAFTKAEELSSAMDSRGYIVGAKRTRSKKFFLTWSDGIFLVIICGFFMLVMISLYYGVNTGPATNQWFKSAWNWWGWRQPSL